MPEVFPEAEKKVEQDWKYTPYDIKMYFVKTEGLKVKAGKRKADALLENPEERTELETKMKEAGFKSEMESEAKQNTTEKVLEPKGKEERTPVEKPDQENQDSPTPPQEKTPEVAPTPEAEVLEKKPEPPAPSPEAKEEQPVEKKKEEIKIKTAETAVKSPERKELEGVLKQMAVLGSLKPENKEFLEWMETNNRRFLNYYKKRYMKDGRVSVSLKIAEEDLARFSEYYNKFKANPEPKEKKEEEIKIKPAETTTKSPERTEKVAEIKNILKEEEFKKWLLGKNAKFLKHCVENYLKDTEHSMSEKGIANDLAKIQDLKKEFKNPKSPKLEEEPVEDYSQKKFQERMSAGLIEEETDDLTKKRALTNRNKPLRNTTGETQKKTKMENPELSMYEQDIEKSVPPKKPALKAIDPSLSIYEQDLPSNKTEEKTEKEGATPVKTPKEEVFVAPEYKAGKGFSKETEKSEDTPTSDEDFATVLELSKDPKFNTFLANYDDAETLDPEKDAEKIKIRHEAYKALEEVSSERKELYQKDLFEKFGFRLDAEEFETMDKLLLEQAVKNPEKLIEQKKNLDRYDEIPNEIEKEEEKIKKILAEAKIEDKESISQILESLNSEEKILRRAQKAKEGWWNLGEKWASAKELEKNGTPYHAWLFEGDKSIEARLEKIKKARGEYEALYVNIAEIEALKVEMGTDHGLIQEKLFLKFEGEADIRERVQNKIKGRIKTEGTWEEDLDASQLYLERVRNAESDYGIDYTSGIPLEKMQEKINASIEKKVKESVQSIFADTKTNEAVEKGTINYEKIIKELQEKAGLGGDATKYGSKEGNEAKELLIKALSEVKIEGTEKQKRIKGFLKNTVIGILTREVKKVA